MDRPECHANSLEPGVIKAVHVVGRPLLLEMTAQIKPGSEFDRRDTIMTVRY